MFRYGFKKTIQQLGADYGSSVLAAVSGGMDSMCMLDALLHCQLNLKVSVAHVNFNLRGEESDQDTAMVEQWCAEHNVTLYKESFNTEEYASQRGISIEMAARDLRYNWFYTLMAEHKLDFLAIAHNANDNAETLMLNLTRGCGIDGLGGIREKVAINSSQAQDSKPQYIIRPLISYSRQQIEKYALKFKVPYRTDSTNLLSDYSRNRIRNEVFPQLARINPSVIATFNRNIRHFRQAASVLEKAVEEKCSTICHRFNFFHELAESRFAGTMCGLNLKMNLVMKDGQDLSLIRCIVGIKELMDLEQWEFWVYRIAAGYGFSPAIIDDICKALETEDGPKKFLSGNGEYIAVKERGLLKFYMNVVMNGNSVLQTLEWCGLKIDTTLISRESWRTRKPAGELCPTLYLDADKLEMPLKCKPIEPGDRFSPLGLKGSKKITDYLTDIKFENLHKGSVLAMCDNSGKVVALPGLQISNHARVTESSKNILQIRIL